MKKGNANQAYLLSFAAAIITACVLAHMIQAFGAKTAWDGGVVAVWAWAGFVVATMGTNYLFENRSHKLFAIVSGHHLAAMILMGVILAIF